MFPTLAINAQRCHLGTVWVHLQRLKSGPVAFYNVDIPLSRAEQIFGARKPEFPSWTNQVWDDIANYGTFIIENYFQDKTKLTNEQRGSYEWVIATVDDIIELEDVIRLSGKAVPFHRDRETPELRELE